MEKFKLTETNAPFCAQAFETNYMNAKGIIRGQYEITETEFMQLQADYDFNKFAHLLPKKERKKENVFCG